MTLLRKDDSELVQLMVRVKWAYRACLVFAVLNTATIAWRLFA